MLCYAGVLTACFACGNSTFLKHLKIELWCVCVCLCVCVCVCVRAFVCVCPHTHTHTHTHTHHLYQPAETSCRFKNIILTPPSAQCVSTGIYSRVSEASNTRGERRET